MTYPFWYVIPQPESVYKVLKNQVFSQIQNKMTRKFNSLKAYDNFNFQQITVLPRLVRSPRLVRPPGIAIKSKHALWINLTTV